MDSAKDLTVGSIIRGITSLAAPLIAASFIQMAYTLTDMAWVGKLGSEPIAAIGAASIIIWFCNSASLVTKIGAEVSISQSLGASNRLKAKQYANHVAQLSVILSLFLACMVFLISPFFIRIFNLTSEINATAVSYLRLASIGLFCTCCNNAFGGIYYGTGNSQTPFRIAAIGLVCNIVLDPLLIFGYLGLPALGTDGAAIATTLSQLLVFVLYATRLFRKQHFALGRLSLLSRLQRNQSLHILRLGLPVSLQNMLFALLSMTITHIVSGFGYLGVAAYSVGGQIEAISWMTAGGFSTALGAFVGQNYGAGQFRRIKDGYRISMLMAGSIGAIAGVLFMLYGEAIFSLFVNEPETVRVGGEYLTIMGISQLFMVIELVTAGAFNGVGRTTPPALVSIVFNVMRVPMAYLLVQLSWLGITGAWWSITISSIFKGTVLVAWFCIVILRHLPKQTAKRVVK